MLHSEALEQDCARCPPLLERVAQFVLQLLATGTPSPSHDRRDGMARRFIWDGVNPRQSSELVENSRASRGNIILGAGLGQDRHVSSTSTSWEGRVPPPNGTYDSGGCLRRRRTRGVSPDGSLLRAQYRRFEYERGAGGGLDHRLRRSDGEKSRGPSR